MERGGGVGGFSEMGEEFFPFKLAGITEAQLVGLEGITKVWNNWSD